MSIDLTLIPIDHESAGHRFGHSLLHTECTYHLFDSINPLPALQIDRLSCYMAQSEDGERGYGDATETPYGEPLTFTTAGELLKVADHPDVLNSRRNRAVWAYLAQLEGEARIVLFWH